MDILLTVVILYIVGAVFVLSYIVYRQSVTIGLMGKTIRTLCANDGDKDAEIMDLMVCILTFMEAIDDEGEEE